MNVSYKRKSCSKITTDKCVERFEKENEDGVIKLYSPTRPPYTAQNDTIFVKALDEFDIAYGPKRKEEEEGVYFEGHEGILSCNCRVICSIL